jgi:hypothetical protein
MPTGSGTGSDKQGKKSTLTLASTAWPGIEEMDLQNAPTIVHQDDQKAKSNRQKRCEVWGNDSLVSL